MVCFVGLGLLLKIVLRLMTKNVASPVVGSTSLSFVTACVVCDLTSSRNTLLYVSCVHSETLLYITILLDIYAV